ncbi:MAG: hypothetical protein WBV93_06615 [Anaerobacillus sp.]
MITRKRMKQERPKLADQTKFLHEVSTALKAIRNDKREALSKFPAKAGSFLFCLNLSLLS